MTLEIQVPAWEWHTNMAWLNRLIGSQPSPHNWISNGNIYNKLQNKPCTDWLPLGKTTYYLKNEWQLKHWQYNSRVNESSWR
jgi:hypothetical protein